MTEELGLFRSITAMQPRQSEEEVRQGVSVTKVPRECHAARSLRNRYLLDGQEYIPDRRQRG